MRQRTGLRKREIAFAIGVGALAAGGAALVLADDDPTSAAVIAAPMTQQLAPFDRIATTGPQDLVVAIGEGHAVRAEGSPESLEQFEWEVVNGSLAIRPTRGFGRFDWARFSDVTFHVTMPRLEALKLSGSGEARVDRVDGDAFEGAIEGSGELSIEDMRVDRADFSIAGSGSVEAAGAARETSVSIMGSGDVDADGLRSEIAEVRIAGSGDAALTVEREARVSIMGSGDVDITGPARCSVSRAGSGEGRCNGSTD